MRDRLGQQLGNYRLTRLLTQGSFAEVYLGEHVSLGTMVAIKILHARVTEEEVAQFEQEARLLASLRHPHIIRILDFGLDRRTPYLVMDYAPNGTLRTRHPRGTQLPVSTVVDYVKQIAEALQYAHDHKVVHRDVKPENILIGEKNAILLSDFGIALIAQSSRYQSTTGMVGTIAYMAPEQISAQPCQASDQYSLGVIAYEWLCGTRPFDGSFAEIAIKHTVTLPPSPRKHLPMLSPDVEYVLLTALEKQPEKRFPSVSAFATALEQASQDMLPTAQLRHLPTPEKPTSKPAVSRRAVLMGTAGVATVAAVGTSVLLIAHEQLPQGGAVMPPSRTATPPKATATPRTAMATPTNQPFIYREHSSSIETVAWSPDGQRIASGSFDHTVRVWNASDGGHVSTYTGHSREVWGVTWSLDGKQIASCSGDTTVQVWNASDGSHVFTYQDSGGVWGVAWSPDGKRIASCTGARTVQVWNVSDGSHVSTYRGHASDVRSVAWSSDGQQIASGSFDKTVHVWNVNDGSNVFKYTLHTDLVETVAWSPDGKRIASGSSDNTVQIWSRTNRSNIFIYRGHNAKVRSVAWSPDGQRIASGSWDKTVRVWNVKDGSDISTYTGYSNGVESVAWSPDGKRIASGSDDQTAQVWYVV